ncbi:DUF1330 domain-containing protein [Priestia megaterium]
MSAYMVYVRDRIIDPAELKKYEGESAKIPASNGPRPLAFYGAVKTLEGPTVDGAVILEFPTVADAKAAYDDPNYQAIIKHRLKGAEYRVFIVDGM